MNLVVVEDQIESRELLLELLDIAPFDETISVKCFGRLKEAIEWSNMNSVDLAMLDLDLPDSFGPQTVKTYREQVTGVPVIVMSGNQDPDVISKCLDYGASNMFSKGEMKPDTLASKLCLVINQDIERNNFERILSYQEDGILVLDDKLSILFANNQGKKLLNLDGDQKALEKIPMDGKIDEYQTVIESKGNFIPLKITQKEIVWSGKEAKMLIVKDITTDYLADYRLQKMEDLMNAKNEFTANMSHEIRTPLHAIVSISRRLNRESLTPSAQALAKLLLPSAETLIAIVDDVLDFSKIEVGKLQINESTVDIKRLCNQIADFYKPLATDANLELNLFLDEDAPRYIIGDNYRIRQVLSNFLSNAFKYTQMGSISLKYKMQIDENSGTRYLRFSVTDTGKGIPDDLLKYLFEPFYQVEIVSKKESCGTGLGLTICKKLAELMNGSIGVKTNLGKGSTFWFDIPCSIPENLKSQEPKLTLEKPRELNSIASLKSSLTDIPVNSISLIGKVLLVEDNDVNRHLIMQDLTELGLSVDTVNSGMQALKRLKSNSYDMVFMDYHMPGLDGYSTAIEIRKREKRDGKIETPIIAITADVLETSRKRCLAAGINDFVPKPYSPECLYSVCKKFIEGRNGTNLQTNQTVVNDSKVPDTSRFSELLLSSNELAIQILNKFSIDAQRNLLAFKKAVETMDLETAVESAHALKGVTGFLGLKESNELLKLIESQLMHSNWQSTNSLLLNLESDLRKYIEKADTYSATNRKEFEGLIKQPEKESKENKI